jgi:hypothetical protein
MIVSDTLAPYLGNFLHLVTDELGYQPDHSLAAYGITADGPNRAFRIPLYDQPVTLEHLHYLSSQLDTHGCTTAVLIAYSDGPNAAHSLDRARFECEASGINILAMFTVPSDAMRPQPATAGVRA